MVSFSSGKVLGLPRKDILLQAESQGNGITVLTRLSCRRGLGLELLTIPKEKFVAVKELLKDKTEDESAGRNVTEDRALSDDPWQGILDEEHKKGLRRHRQALHPDLRI
jgi:hypothetical protein